MLGCHSDAAVGLKQPSQNNPLNTNPKRSRPRRAPAERFHGTTWFGAGLHGNQAGVWFGDGLFLTGFPAANCFFRSTEDNNDADDISAAGWTAAPLARKAVSASLLHLLLAPPPPPPRSSTSSSPSPPTDPAPFFSERLRNSLDRRINFTTLGLYLGPLPCLPRCGCVGRAVSRRDERRPTDPPPGACDWSEYISRAIKWNPLFALN